MESMKFIQSFSNSLLKNNATLISFPTSFRYQKMNTCFVLVICASTVDDAVCKKGINVNSNTR